jgi:hypothetical protein
LESRFSARNSLGGHGATFKNKLFQHEEHGDTEITEKINLETAFNAEIAEKDKKLFSGFLCVLCASAISAIEAVSRLKWSQSLFQRTAP